MVPRKTRPLRPRSHPRTAHARQRIGSLRNLHRDARHHEIHPGVDLRRGGQADPVLRALLDRGRRTRRGGCRTRHPRLRHQVLHRRRQLGPRGQQHPGLLPARSAEVSRPEPRHQARPAHRTAQPEQQLGLLDAAARGAASGDHHDVAARHSGLLPPHARIRKPHVQPLRQRQPTHVGQVPPPHRAGDQEPDRRGGRGHHRQGPRIEPARPVRSHRTRRLSALADAGAADDRGAGPDL